MKKWLTFDEWMILGMMLAVAVFALFMFLKVSNAEQRGATKAAVAQLVAKRDTLIVHERAVDTVHVRDSVRSVAWVTRYDTVTVRDTVTLHDTLYVRKALADSTIRACVLADNSCERAKAVRDSIIETLNKQIAEDARLATLARHQTLRDKITWGVVSGAAGRLSCLIWKC